MLADVPIDTVTPELSEVTVAPVKLNACESIVSEVVIKSAFFSVITGRNTVLPVSNFKSWPNDTGLVS